MSYAAEHLSRQSRVFPDALRTQTAIIDVGGLAAGLTSTFLKAGAAVAQVASVSDYAGPSSTGGHLLRGPHLGLVRTLSGGRQALDFIDADHIVQELGPIGRRHARPALVLYVNDPVQAYGAAAALAAAGIDVPVWLVLVGSSGVVIERSRPAVAAARLEGLRGQDVIPSAAEPELHLLAAGGVLGEIMLAGTLPEAAGPGLVLAYLLRRPRRLDVPPETAWSQLVAEVCEPVARPSFGGRRWVQVGAGGLGNPAAAALALECGLDLTVWDADSVSATNLNRQFLFTDADIGHPKAATLAAALRALDKDGSYRGVCRFLRQPSDLEPLDAAGLLVWPDNDEARLVGAQVAWDHQVLMATAASSATGGYAAVQQPGRACLACVLGGATRHHAHEHQSCASLEDDQIVATNMVLAGIAVSELRMALSGAPAVNLRYLGTSPGNHLARMVSDPPCPHRIHTPFASSSTSVNAGAGS